MTHHAPQNLYFLRSHRPILEAELDMRNRASADPLLDFGRQDFYGLRGIRSTILETPPLPIPRREGRRDIALSAFAELLPTALLCAVNAAAADLACKNGPRGSSPSDARRVIFARALQVLESVFKIRLIWSTADETAAIVKGCFTQQNMELLSRQKTTAVRSV